MFLFSFYQFHECSCVTHIAHKRWEYGQKENNAQQLKAQSVNKTHTVQMLHRRDERQGTNETGKKVHRKKAKSAPSTNIKLIKPRFKLNKNNLEWYMLLNNCTDLVFKTFYMLNMCTNTGSHCSKKKAGNASLLFSVNYDMVQ